jgi:hypothetical protein
VQETAISTKVITRTIKNGVKVSLHGRAATNIKEITKEMCEVGMVKCFGRMEAIIKANGSMAFSMEKVSYLLYR